MLLRRWKGVKYNSGLAYILCNAPDGGGGGGGKADTNLPLPSALPLPSPPQDATSPLVAGGRRGPPATQQKKRVVVAASRRSVVFPNISVEFVFMTQLSMQGLLSFGASDVGMRVRVTWKGGKKHVSISRSRDILVHLPFPGVENASSRWRSRLLQTR